MRNSALFLILFWAGLGHAYAEPVPPDTLLVRRGEARVTAQDFEAALQRIPAEYRATVANTPKHISDLIAQLLENRLLAVEARERGLLEEDLVQAQVRLETEKLLATKLLQRVVAEKSSEADYPQLAEEYYLTHKQEFTTRPIVSVTHVMIGTKERSEQEAKALAQEVYAKATAENMALENLVAEYSDDPAAAQNQGHYADTPLDGFVPPFAEAVGELEPGEISEPVKTIYGYHVIRLDAREPARLKPLEEVKDELVKRMEKEHADEIRQTFLQGLIQDNPIEANPDSIELLQRAYGDPAATED